jgi:hypothetical protein
VNVFCISECCPVGCGMPVVLLGAEGSDTIFCYCDGCGCAWRTPTEARRESGLNDVTPLAHFAPRGFILPTKQQVAAAGFADAIVSELPAAKWGVFR